MILRFSTGFCNESLKSGGKSYADILENGIIRLFGGIMPADADLTEGSNHLVQITNNGGPFTAGVGTNGINFDVAASRILSQKSGEIWSGLGTAEAGTAGKNITWGCFYDNAVTTGASDTGKRIYFDCATSGAFCTLKNPLAVLGVSTSLGNNATMTMPAYVYR